MSNNIFRRKNNKCQILCQFIEWRFVKEMTTFVQGDVLFTKTNWGCTYALSVWRNIINYSTICSPRAKLFGSSPQTYYPDTKLVKIPWRRERWLEWRNNRSNNCLFRESQQILLFGGDQQLEKRWKQCKERKRNLAKKKHFS